MTRRGGSRGSGNRLLHERVRTARGRKSGSTRWLERQLNDPYVAEARQRGLRSRAAFKLMELDDRFGFLAPGARVLDLGAAPGGWSQVVADRIRLGDAPAARLVAVDLLAIEPLPGATCLQCDFLDEAAPAQIREALAGPADAVLTDMAANATGHPPTDHLRIMALLEAAWVLARDVLAPGGHFVGKVLKGGTEAGLLTDLKRHFSTVRHAKPPASRKESAESYLVAMDFRAPP